MLKLCTVLFGLVLVVSIFSVNSVYADSDVEAVVRAYFADAPVMIKVAECESKFRQFTDSGNVLMGGYGGQMVGVFQLYGSVHRGDALALGADINTLAGNVQYARHLYEMQGTAPWMDSFPCWNDKTTEGGTSTPVAINTTQPTATALVSSNALSFSTNLSFGMVHSDILVLQKLLNGAGFTIAPSGPGAPGEETTKFGSLTRDAVRKFQCAKYITCEGDEYSTGYGFVGPKTRQLLMSTPQSPVARAPSSTSTNPTVDNSAEIASIKKQIADLQARLQVLEP